MGSHTHCICAATGLCPGLLELFLAQDSVPDEDREGARQLLIQFSHTVLAAQRELGLLRGDPRGRLDELDGSTGGGGSGSGTGSGSLAPRWEAGRIMSRVPGVAPKCLSPGPGETVLRQAPALSSCTLRPAQGWMVTA